MSKERHAVLLTEDEINALIVTIGKVKISEVHLCRCKEVHNGLKELQDMSMDLGRRTLKMM